MQRIEEFSTNELINELCKRYDHWVFGARLDKCEKTGKVERLRFYKGDYDVCAGLMHGPIKAATDDNWGVSAENVINYHEGT